MAQIDYDALAQQHGGQPAVNYDDIAKQAGGQQAASGNPPPPSTPPAQPSSFMDTAKDVGIGALKGVGSTANSIGRMLYPDALAKHLTGIVPPETEQSYFAPKNTAQTVGKGIEQAGEFLVPGGAEEAGAEGLAKLAPALGKAAKPAARVLTSGVSSGLVNKAQGGDFSTGAELGSGGAALGAGVNAAAPIMAESAMRLPAKMRGFGRTTGRAILDETKGVTPEAVGESAKGKIGDLYSELEDKATAASARPNRIRGLLPAPAQEIPLSAPLERGSTRGGLFDAGKNTSPVPGVDASPRSSFMAGQPGHEGERTVEDPGYVSGGEHPELSGRYAPPKGVLIRPFEASVGARPISPTEPATNASLRPARNVLGQASSLAHSQNAETLGGQLGRMQNTIGRRFDTGESIPENITPLEMLRLKQGFSGEHLRWNPEIHEAATAAGRNAYHAMDQELDRTVPGAEGLNQRISSLIPAKVRGESLSRENPFLQRMGQRIGARTGALTMGGLLGAEGYREHGGPGAALGFATGAALPELIADPTAQMAAARLLNHANTLKPAVGLLSQGTSRNQ